MRFHLSGPADWCWAFQILPFMEQDNVFRPANAITTVGTIPPNVGIKTYMCPGRGRQQFSTTGANNIGGAPGFNGPFTDYKINWLSFDNRSNLDPGRLTLPGISSLNGTSNTIYVGEGYLNPNEYRRNHGSNWEEVIYSGGYGGTGRGCVGNTTVINNTCVIDLRQDNISVGQSNRWGGPHSSGALFVFCDGSVRTLPYSLSGTMTVAARALEYRNNVPLDFP